MDYKTGLSFYLFSFFTIYQYIYITETFETPTNFHVSTIFKKKTLKKKNVIKDTLSHRLSTKQKKTADPKTQIIFPDQTSDSNLQFFAAPPYTHRSN